MIQDTITVTPPVEPVEEIVAEHPAPTVAPASKSVDSIGRADTVRTFTPSAVHRPSAVDSLAMEESSKAPTDDDATPALPDSLPLLYLSTAGRDSLMARDSLLFADKDCTSAFGMNAQRLPFALHRNDGVTAVLLCCFVLTMMIIRNRQRKLGQQLRNFFTPTHKAVVQPNEIEGLEPTHLFLGLQLSLLVALLFYSYAQACLPLHAITFNHLILLGVYALVTFLMLVAKQCLYSFVHSVFFTSSQRRQWYRDASLLFAIESLLLFPLALLSVYFDLPYQTAGLLLLFLLLFVKILFLFKCFDAFFAKFYGVLHLFAYLCALEIAPIVLLWTILVELTHTLTEI